MTDLSKVREKYKAIEPLLDERTRRIWAAIEAQAYGWGGVSKVAEATGMSRSTINIGIEELKKGLKDKQEYQSTKQIRKRGAGRKLIETQHPKLLEELESLVDPATRGDPQSPLKWTCKSTQKLAQELTSKGYKVSVWKVASLLHQMNYSLQSNRKSHELSNHPDRNEQFEHINATVKSFQHSKQPVISVDAKKKELIGDFKNAGQEWQPKGQPEKVRGHDFLDKELGKVTPYGVYDIINNEGWVSVGIDHDTAEFAVESIKQWWKQMGAQIYPNATDLLITADGGGSNGSRTRLWKLQLQKFVDETGLTIHVCHFPPGTSKWNKIEHRMFAHITQNWRGRPLLTREVVVNLIANTTTNKGLRIKAELDINKYQKGIKVSDVEIEGINLTRSDFHGEWNYKIAPKYLKN